jgi:hypothetical protein
VTQGAGGTDSRSPSVSVSLDPWRPPTPPSNWSNGMESLSSPVGTSSCRACVKSKPRQKPSLLTSPITPYPQGQRAARAPPQCRMGFIIVFEPSQFARSLVQSARGTSREALSAGGAGFSLAEWCLEWPPGTRGARRAFEAQDDDRSGPRRRSGYSRSQKHRADPGHPGRPRRGRPAHRLY